MGGNRALIRALRLDEDQILASTPEDRNLDALPPHVPEDELALRTALDVSRTLEGPTKDVERFRRASLTAVEFLLREIPSMQPLLGDNLIVRGEMAVIAGKPGVGKTWLTLQLAIALAAGHEFLGLHTHGGCNAGFVSLELNDFALQQRIDTLTSGDKTGLERLHVLTASMIGGVVDLNPEQKDNDLASLRSWVEGPAPGSPRLDVIVVDALSRASTLPEVDLRSLLRALDALRLATGCAIILIHHERKGDRGDTGGDDLDAFRGDSALVSFATCCIRVTTVGGVKVIRFAKVTNGPTPAPIFFALEADGCPAVTNAPEVQSKARGDKTAAAVLKAVFEAGPTGITNADIATQVSRNRNTVTSHLGGLVESVRTVGCGKATRYVHIDHLNTSASQSAQSAQSDINRAEQKTAQQ